MTTPQLSDFKGPTAARNLAIVQMYLRYNHPVALGQHVVSEGSVIWIGAQFGISGSAVAGVVHRWKVRVRNRGDEPEQTKSEPSKPRVISMGIY